MRRRSGFTLVELLVAMALIVFMMLILSEAFTAGLGAFSRLKAIGDMNARLRTAVVALQDDLQADHFEGRRRVSDPTFWAFGPPNQGFFRIYHGGPRIVENTDVGGDGIPSTRAVNHILHMTVKKRGNNPKDFFIAKVPAGSPLPGLGVPGARYQDALNVFTSQWAEVAYFLRPNGNTAGATPLYALYRRQRVVVPTDVAAAVAAGEMRDYLEVSARPVGANLIFNGPMDLTMPQHRLGMDPATAGGVIEPFYSGLYPSLEVDAARYPGGPDLANADLLLPDVISFEITVLLENGSGFVDLYDPTVTAFNYGNPQFTRPNGPRVFDTWSAHKDSQADYTSWDVRGSNTSIPLYQDANVPPNQIRITAVKITLRVWDVKTLQARQVSLIQDL